MMIQNALSLLQELSELEEKINFFERQIVLYGLDVDTEELLQKVVSNYRKQRE